MTTTFVWNLTEEHLIARLAQTKHRERIPAPIFSAPYTVSWIALRLPEPELVAGIHGWLRFRARLSEPANTLCVLSLSPLCLSRLLAETWHVARGGSF